MKPSLKILLAATLTLGASLSQAHDHQQGHHHAHSHSAHVHGHAQLMVAVEEKQVQVSLESPLDNLLGFEHAPRTAKEKQAVEAMTTRLKAPETLLQFDPEAGCKALPAEISALPGTAGQGKHGDLTAEFSFTCANPPRYLEVRLFTAFPRLQRLEAQLATPKGQAAHRLAPGKTRLSW